MYIKCKFDFSEQLDANKLRIWNEVMKRNNHWHGLDALYRATKQNGNIYEI